MSSTSKRAAAAPPPQLHFDDGSRIMTSSSEEQQQHPTTSSCPRGSVSIETYYEIDRLAHEIKQLSTTQHDDDDDIYSCRVALQFPDELLKDAPHVCWAMEHSLGKNALVFILGDTTFGPCCPDKVSAMHLDATVLVHYGHACLSNTSGNGDLPVLYSFGITNMNVEACVDSILKQVQQEEETVENLLLLYEVRYEHAMTQLADELKRQGGLSVVVGQIPRPHQCNEGATSDNETLIDSDPTNTTASSSDKFVVGGLELPADLDLSSYTLLFVGDDNTKSRQYVNVMLRFLSMSAGPCRYWTYSPSLEMLETSLPPSLQRQLNRRFYLTQKARDASVYGILVGTLSQQHFTSVVSTLQKVIQDAGKSCYTFAVGKINGAKLANFGEIECFVLVACGENSLLDNERDLHVPVITPLELDIALGNVEWGPYSLNYNDFLAQQAERATTTSTTASDDDDDEEDAPYFSLVSGKYVDSKKPSEAVDLSALPGKGQLAAYKSEASNYLKQREYQGLKANIGKDEAHAAVQGQAGIASNYGNR
jgi:diphthamide biosynthesis protein 2